MAGSAPDRVEDATIAGSVDVCIACDAVDTRPLYEVNGFAVIQCTCGLARTVLPRDFDPASIYTEDYFQGGHPDGYADYQGSGYELRHEFRRILDALVRTGASGRLIEFGCAFGFFLDEARESFTTCGVEISDHARTVSQERGHDVVREATPEFLESRGPFDAAVMLDVLEHMRDPRETLDLLHAAMRPGAQLVVTTGDFGSVLARSMGRRWRLMTPPQHLWFFSPATVSALLQRHGFRVHTIEHPWKLVPLALVAYQATRYLGGQALVRRFIPGGRLPINLFDAMRVIAERVDRDDVPAGPTAPTAARSSASRDAHAERYELARRLARGRVLDLTCGTGDGTRRLADGGGAIVELVGVDPSPDTITSATRHHARPGLRFAVADPQTFADPDPFDTVVSLDTLEYADDPEALIVRLIAALRPGGLLITSIPTTPVHPDARHFDEAAFRTMLQRYGMRPIDRIEQTRTYRPRGLTGYYLRHPRAIAKRLASTLRHGLTNRYVTIAWQRD